MFLPTTIKEVRERGWDQLDVILFSGDAYIDHPAFGAAVVGRLLEAEGYRVAIVPQPNWRDDLRDFRKLGAPRLFFGISGGSMDSMVNHYTANLRLRHDDAYTPGGKAGFRPDRAVTVYSQILKRLYPHVPVVIGGIEASLRRLTHYDYWSDALKPSILAESGADLLIYGMGERVVQQVARAMRNGYNAKLLRKIRQVAFLSDESYVARLDPAATIRLRSYEECLTDKTAFGENFTVIETQSNLMEPTATLVEAVGDRCVVVTPANTTLTTEELDHSFDLPYERAPHPRYAGKGDIPAWEMIRHSVNIPRLLRRLLVLHHFGASGQVHQFAQRAVDPRRSGACGEIARFQGLSLGCRRTLGQHVPHGRPRQGAVPQVPPSVVPPPEDVPQSRQRPPAAAGPV